MRARNAPLLLLLLLVAAGGAMAPGCRRGPPERHPPISDELADRVSRAASSLAAELADQPGLLPPEPEERTPLVLVFFDHGESPGQRPLGPRPVRGGSLAYDRLRASTRSRPAEHWVVMTDPTAERVIYWAPVSSPGLLRLEYPPHGVDGCLVGVVQVALHGLLHIAWRGANSPIVEIHE